MHIKFLFTIFLLTQSISLLSQDIIDKFYCIKFGDKINNPRKIKKIESTEYHRLFKIKGVRSIFCFDTLGRLEKHFIYSNKATELIKFYSTKTDTTIVKKKTNSLIKDNNIVYTSESSNIFYYMYGILYRIEHLSKQYKCVNENFCYSDSSISFEEQFNNFTYLHTYTHMYDTFCNCNAVVKKEFLIKAPQIIDTTDNTLYRNNSNDRDIYIFNSNNVITDIIRISKSGFVGIPYIEENGVGISHIKFTNFDEHGNWTRSYFILGNKRKFLSKRKITYYE